MVQFAKLTGLAGSVHCVIHRAAKWLCQCVRTGESCLL